MPAFVGLGTPYWDPEARGAIVGLTRGVTRAHIVRATLEALAYQTRDVVDTMAAESGKALAGLRVDGGASANDFLMQFQADLLGATVDRPQIIETTALGAALLAGRGVGLWPSAEKLERARKRDRLFKPRLPPRAPRSALQGLDPRRRRGARVGQLRRRNFTRRQRSNGGVDERSFLLRVLRFSV